MKNNIIVALSAALTLMAIAVPNEGCSAAQKQAEADLAKNTGDCILECGIEEALDSKGPEQAAIDCGERCGGKAVTDPQTLADLARIMAGTKTAAAKRAAATKRDAGQ